MDRSVVVYTANYNDYDVVLPPKNTEENVDFVCFTDTPNKIPDPWQTRTIDSTSLSPKLKSGKVKCLPHKYFSEYDISIWVDANVAIEGSIRDFIQKFESSAIAVPSHPKRECTYQEAVVCIKQGLAEKHRVEDHVECLQSLGFPSQFGLSETRVVIRKHQHTSVKKAMDIWWKYYSNGPERDQLSFDFAMWKADLEYTQFSPKIATNSQFFHLNPHKSEMYPSRLYEILLRRVHNSRPSLMSLPMCLLLKFLLGIRLARSAIEILHRQGPWGLSKRVISRVRESFYR